MNASSDDLPGSGLKHRLVQVTVPHSLPPELANHSHYIDIRELGKGGMGVVYLAKNTLMGREEVLKVINRTLLDKPGALERFLQEIQAAARLGHPNVVAAYSADRLGDLLVFAMEYVPGEDLEKVVKAKGPLSIPHACYFVQQAALGLQHAHQKGMVHRDIKPSNLILAREGKKPIVKVLDFGLAKVIGDGPDANLTGEGRMMGTPDYIAPEQALDAAKADIRSDIYSLGCTLYFLLTGRPPFRGASLYELLRHHESTEAVSLNLVRPDVPVELATVVSKMMAKKPQKRYQSPGDVAKALAPFLKPGATPASSPPRSESLPPPIVIHSETMGPKEPTRDQVIVPVVTVAPIAAPKRSKTMVAPSAWESLAEDEKPSPRRAKPKPRRRSPASWIVPLAVGVVLVGVVGFAWMGGLFSSKSKTEPASVEKDEPRKVAKLPEQAKIPVEPTKKEPSPKTETSTQDPVPAKPEPLPKVPLPEPVEPVVIPKPPVKTLLRVFGGRVGEERKKLVQSEGGTEASEKAVAAGLAWLAKQQKRDGSWEFVVPKAVAGSNDVIAATGLALLAFLGNGDAANSDTAYSKTVEAGIKFLVSKEKAVGKDDGSFAGVSSMYSHGIATTALSEATAMYADGPYRGEAFRAMSYLVKAQTSNGSWGYQAGAIAGDTSITGWQIQAYEAANKCLGMGITVMTTPSMAKASKFLTTVSKNNGANYGYTAPGDTVSLTAVGLYCRGVLGWGPETPAMMAGAKFLAANLPTKTTWDIYTLVYAQRVMHAQGGELWSKTWNPKVRDLLVELQAPNTNPALAGSWPPDTGYIGNSCGRLGTTALSVLTLQVYYRYPRVLAIKTK